MREDDSDPEEPTEHWLPYLIVLLVAGVVLFSGGYHMGLSQQTMTDADDVGPWTVSTASDPGSEDIGVTFVYQDGEGFNAAPISANAIGGEITSVEAPNPKGTLSINDAVRVRVGPDTDKVQLLYQGQMVAEVIL